MTEVERESTPYDGFVVEYMPKGHRYAIVPKDEKRKQVPSVTGILKVLDKPALLAWSERCGVEGALRMERTGGLTYSDGSSVPVEDAVREVRQAKEGADAKRDAGGERGLALHEAQETYCELGDVPNVGDFDPEVRGYVQGYCRWLLRDEPEPIFTERVVGSVEHGYAGRIDMLARIKGRICMPDLKTAAKPYPEQHLQIAGYLGTFPECFPDIEVEEGLVVLVGADGTFETYPCKATPADFLDVLGCHRALARVRAALRKHEREAA